MKKILTAVLLAVAVAAGIYGITHVMRKDQTPPQISLTSQQLEVSVSGPETALLQGVTAVDDRDGDVTAQIVVEGISDIGRDQTAVVTYAAFDQAGNVSKARRTLLFSDYEPPKFRLVKPLILPEGTTQDVLDFLQVTDQLDGDISGRIKGNLVSNTTSLSYAGMHQVEFRVTNSMGDTVRITLPVDVYPVGTFNSTLELSDNLIYLEKDAPFRPEAFLKSLTVGSVSYALDGSDSSVQVQINGTGAGNAEHIVRLQMESNVNPQVPGVYSVTYTATMDGVHTGFVRLNVVVEE